ncbi:MAG: DoxX family protein [Nonomuraea sp.]|nr:DoxX family protein [Nonomuraea sp.]NUP80886.1 DoxX family protein [Nonomuraea sp.]NUS02437.1 DoxX family protein [Nonomuraea sp.]NUT12392.1 DoxX family protein [Nonomuraea sp.]
MKRTLFDVAALISRVVLGVIFVAHGWQKWQGGLGAAAGQFREMGVPMPELSAGFATIVELVGGVLLILGLLVRPVALLLLIDMIGAIVFVHAGHGVLSQGGGWELPGALGALALLFAALGGGRFGIDGIFNSMFHRRKERRIAEDDLATHRPVRRAEPTTVVTEGGPTTPARPEVEAEQPNVPKQPSGPRAGHLNDEDMRDIDALVSDEPTQQKPPNR